VVELHSRFAMYLKSVLDECMQDSLTITSNYQKVEFSSHAILEIQEHGTVHAHVFVRKNKDM